MTRRRPDPAAAPAVVMGDTDLVRPLALAGIRCAVFAEPQDPVRRSRGVTALIPWVDHWAHPEAVIDRLLEHAATLAGPPVLFPQTDGDLMAVSRHRDRLGDAVRLLLADADLVEAAVDKAAFARLADSLELPVPPSRRIQAEDVAPGDLGLRLPLVVKPLVRDATRWRAIEGSAKAVHVESQSELAALWERLAAARLPVLAQEAIPGPESRIESFHAYVDAAGDLVAGFTGKKIRTFPQRYGHSSALVLTDVADVRALGEEVVGRLGVRGVAKVDFKRDAGGRLWLLEINPRFTLWHHLAAVAGLNIPAIVHADLSGGPRPPVRRARPGVRWCDPILDVRASRASGVGLVRWARWAASCEAMSDFAWDDPLPLLDRVAGRVIRPVLARRPGRAVAA
jgi:predicted ATP-grasp superfamily ATP-dependent carboligase